MHLETNTTHPPHHKKVLAQWQAYLDVYRSCGREVLLLEDADETLDGIFVEDALIAFPNLDAATK